MLPPVYFILEQKSTIVYKWAEATVEMTSKNRPKRPRNAAATRDAILKSALIAFSHGGYDGVGLREIAQEAGVTAMLVNRYFGSKEALFAEVVEALFADGSLFSGSTEELGMRVSKLIVAKMRQPPASTDPLLLMLRSAPNARAARILRKSIKRQFEEPLAGVLGGREAAMRAGLFLALIAGFQFMHRMIGSEALVEADGTALSRRLASLFQALVDDH
jgi:AcrR family transcriptional regulator